MDRAHGSHTCYCPNCNFELEADVDVKCNTLSCPRCGGRMRAKETGEFHSSNTAATMVAKEVHMPVSTELTSLPCSVCKFPILIPENMQEGQQIKCPSCGSINEAITQGITIPTSVFVGFITFGLGVLLGPALLATTAGGQKWMERRIKERIK